MTNPTRIISSSTTQKSNKRVDLGCWPKTVRVGKKTPYVIVNFRRRKITGIEKGIGAVPIDFQISIGSGRNGIRVRF